MKEVREIAKMIQSMLIAQYGYPWIIEDQGSMFTLSMGVRIMEHDDEYKMHARFVVEQDEDAVRFEILTTTPLSLMFVKDMTCNYLDMDVVCDEVDKDSVAKGIQTFIGKDKIIDRPYAVMTHIIKPYIEAMENALRKYRL